jgi:ABC-type sugar transport system ATPase subunit
MEADPRVEDPAGIVCQLNGIGKHFGATWACRDVNLTLRRAEVHAVLGENGAGKSTLMKILHGLHQPDEGTISLAGHAVHFASPRDAEAAGVALIPQELDLFPDLSLAENLFVGSARPRRSGFGFDWAKMRQRTRTILTSLGVELDVDTPARLLSSANAQMVEIARALLRAATVVLMDEPTAALTSREADRLFTIIKELTARGVSVVYISHRLEEISRIADRVSIMRDGRCVHSGPAAQTTIPELINLMVGRPLEKLFHRTVRVPGEPALEVRGLTRRGAFENISCILRRGEVVGLSGLIGAGRSELAQTLFGLHAPTNGEVLIKGRPARIRNPATAQKNGIAYVPEERRWQGLFLDFPISWNTSFNCLPRMAPMGWVSGRSERALASHFRELFDIRGGTDAGVVGTLSGGNQQKVLLSKCLATEPTIILLDEPTRGVDVGARAEIYRIVDQLANSGKAVLLISSDLNELVSMADRILVMYQGRLMGEFPGPAFPIDRIGAAVVGVRQ